MKNVSRYDHPAAGFAAGIAMPVITALIIWIAVSGGEGLIAYLRFLRSSGTVTHIMSLCVFSNIVIFIVFNRLDMLGAARGTLAVTILWAVAVFLIKLL